MNIFKRVCNRLIRAIRELNVISISADSFIHKNTMIKSADISGKVNIKEGAKVIGNVILKGGAFIHIGKYTSLNGPSTDVRSMINEVKIGSFTSIARGVAIQEFNHNYKTLSTYHIHHNILNEGRKKDVYSSGPIEIGNDVWIGAQCVILSGAKIGNGAIIAANSVVNDEIPPYAIAGGSPAKVIKYRFDQETITLLQEINWWDWPIEKIKLNRELFTTDITAAQLEKFILSKDYPSKN